MARFSDLSNEVVLMIADFVQPRDLDSFFLTSKTIRKLNEASVIEHSTLKRDFSHLDSQTSDEDMNEFGTLANLLKEVLTVPRATSYVKDFDVRGWHTAWNNGSHLDDWRSDDMLSEDNRMIFNKAISCSKYIPANLVDAWMARFEDGDEDQILGLLMTVLPNLSKLNFSDVPRWDSLLSNSIRCISQDPKPQALTILKCVTLSGKDTPIPLHVVKTLAALPSMRQIHAENVSTTIQDEYTSPPDFFTFFYTEHPAIRDDGGAGSNPFWIHNSLKHHAKHSLRKLTLRSPFRKTSTLIGSLARFDVLEELDVDFGAMVNRRRVGIGCRKLTKVLPASIKKVTLRHLPGEDGIESLFCIEVVRDVVMQRKRALPHLQALNFRPDKNGKTLNFPLSVIAACEAAGIALTVD